MNKKKKNLLQLAIQSQLRSPAIRTARNLTFAAANKLGIPESYTAFGKAMTGGVKGDKETKLSDKEIGYIKGIVHNREASQAALEAAKERLQINPLEGAYSTYKNKKGARISEDQYNKLSSNKKKQFRFSGNTKLTPEQLAGNTLDKFNRRGDFRDDGHISLYEYGQVPQSLTNKLGGFQAKRDSKGNLNIRDRWEVNESNTREGDDPYKKWTGTHSDLVEGGKLASRVYDTAETLGTYRPYDIDVKVSKDDYERIPIQQLKGKERIKDIAQDAYGRNYKRKQEIKDIKNPLRIKKKKKKS